MYNCPQHGINCPANFSDIKNLVLKNNKIGKPFGASATASADTRSFESLDNIRKMFGLTELNQLKGASNGSSANICSKTRSLMNIKNMFGLN